LKTLCTIILSSLFFPAFSQYEVISKSLITNEVPEEWSSKQNVSEFFLFTNNTELFLNIRDANNEWKTVQLFDHNPSTILGVTISGATVLSAKTNREINFLYLSWDFELHHSWGDGGFGTKEKYVQVINLDAAELVFEFKPFYQTSGSESVSDSTNAGREYHCEYTVDYEFSHDSLLIKSINISDAYDHSWEESREEVQKTNGPDNNCSPELNEGIYVYDGNTFTRKK